MGHARWFGVMLRQLGGARLDRWLYGRPAAAHEIERYWAALLEAWPAHATYRARSGVRHVFVLEPA
jgi:hypothetical protein